MAAAPAIMTIAIGPSEPRGVRFSRSITKKPMQVSAAACAWPAVTPARIQLRIRGSSHFSRLTRRGDVAAITLAPVGEVAIDG
jgi:hypothetical protein